MAERKEPHPHGMSPREYARRLEANKRYRQRHPEKFRTYKKAARERHKGVVIDMSGWDMGSFSISTARLSVCNW
jgi:hypothetical protein